MYFNYQLWGGSSALNSELHKAVLAKLLNRICGPCSFAALRDGNIYVPINHFHVLMNGPCLGVSRKEKKIASLKNCFCNPDAASPSSPLIAWKESPCAK